MAEADIRGVAAGGDASARAAREAQWLLQIAQRGDTQSASLRQLIAAYDPKVMAFCLRRGMARADAEDLLQDLWTRVCTHAADFEPGRSPSPWIWAIARNLWHDAMRRLYKRREDAGGHDPEVMTEEAEEIPAPACAVPGESAEDCVHRGLQNYARVHDEGAMAVQLRDLEGWNVADLAQFLGRTEGATRTFLSQVRKKLQPFLEPCFELLSN